VLLAGLAYKRDVEDTRESPALKIIELLEVRGAAVSYYDPFVPEIPPTREHGKLAGRRSISWLAAAIARFDMAIICTDHTSVDYGLLVESCPLVIDTRNICARRGIVSDRVVKA
jgi:UDP-N-acetyl-D-glucosamine dehydrogenase